MDCDIGGFDALKLGGYVCFQDLAAINVPVAGLACVGVSSTRQSLALCVLRRQTSRDGAI